MKKREIPVMNVGISLIILIFMNICLAAFAVLSLENAVSDYSLSKKTATHTTQYYNAVNKVQEQLAEKNQELWEQTEAKEKAEAKAKATASKNTQKKAEGKTTGAQATQKKVENKTTGAQATQKKTETKTTNIQSQLKLTETVSKSQKLVVTLQLDETQKYPQYYIAKWQLCSSEDWQADDSLDVYQSGK